MARRHKPSQLKLVEGSRDRRSLALRKGEPVPTGNLIDAPDWLSEDQKITWAYAIDHSPYGLLKKLDRALLVAWVVAETLHKTAAIKLENSPMVLRTEQGAVVQSPYLSILNRQAVILKSLAADLGFSPAARTQISCEVEPRKPDPAERFFHDVMRR